MNNEGLSHKKSIQYTYLPYNEQQSFDKVQSSNNSRPKIGNPLQNACNIEQQQQGQLKQTSQSNNSNVVAAVQGKMGVDSAKKKQQRSRSRQRQRQRGKWQYNRPIFPFDQPQIWNNMPCNKCDRKLQQIGSFIGVDLSLGNRIKDILVLPPKRQSHSLSYAVQFEDERFEKFTSRALMKWYPKQMISFLEQKIFEEDSPNPND